MSAGMYALNPVFNLDARIDLPTCMYSLPVLQISKSIVDGASVGGGDVPPQVLQALAARQEAILAKLENLRAEVLKYTKAAGISTKASTPLQVQQGVSADIVVRCSPSHPPFALPGLISQLATTMSVFTSVHCHSSVSQLPPHLSSFLPTPQVERGQANIKITLIWKEVGMECELMVSPISQSLIRGEVNLIRYFARMYPSIFCYENSSSAASIDNLLDNVTSLLWSSPKDRQPILRPLAVNLGKSSYLSGDVLGIADLALFSAMKQLGLDRDLQPELRKWFTLVSSHLMGGKGRRRSRASSTRKSFQKRRNSERKISERKGSGKENTPQRSIKKEKSPKKEIKEPKQILKSSGKEKTPPKSVTMSHLNKVELFNYFTENGIDFENVEHPEVFTIENMMPYVKHLTGAICKNLFLKDRHKNLYLLSAKYDREFTLSDIAKVIGAKDLRFGEESVMFEKLGVKQGCVTAYALVNDKEKCVKFLVDKQLIDGSHDSVSFHPLVNSATTTISSKDFNKFLYLTHHTVIQF